MNNSEVISWPWIIEINLTHRNRFNRTISCKCVKFHQILLNNSAQKERKNDVTLKNWRTNTLYEPARTFLRCVLKNFSSHSLFRNILFAGVSGWYARCMVKTEVKLSGKKKEKNNRTEELKLTGSTLTWRHNAHDVIMDGILPVNCLLLSQMVLTHLIFSLDNVQPIKMYLQKCWVCLSTTLVW